MIRIPETYREALGIALLEERKRRGVTGTEIGRAAGVPQSTWSRWEWGHTQPSLEQVVACLGELGAIRVIVRARMLLEAATLPER